MKLFKAFLIAFAIMFVVVGAIAGAKALQIRALIASSKEKAVPPESVSSAAAIKDRWERTVVAPGSLRAVQGADLSTEASGVVTKILFENGAEVKQGDLLVELDCDTERAQLRSAEAEADLARTVYERTKKLRENSTVPQAEMDAAESQLRKMSALVEQLRATISKKQLVAPFTGRLGIREVNLGQFVNNGSKIVSLQSLDPIYVDFLLPQQLLSALAAGQPIRVSTDAYPGRVFTGELTAINSEIDPITRNIRLQGTLKNPDGALRPGMFAQVLLTMGGADDVLRIPSTALIHAPYGDSVYVLEQEAQQGGAPKMVAKQRFVRIGRSFGDFVAVTEGLKEGEQVVSAGAFKLRNGAAVVVNNEMAPQPQAQPTPPNS